MKGHGVLDERLDGSVREARRASPGDEAEADHLRCRDLRLRRRRRFQVAQLTRQAAPVARGGGAGRGGGLGDARNDGHQRRRFVYQSPPRRVVRVCAGGIRTDRADGGSTDRDDRGAPASRARERGEQSRRTPPRVVVVVRGVREHRHEVGFGGDERRVFRVVRVATHDDGAELALARVQERVQVARVARSRGQLDHGDGKSAAAMRVPRVEADAECVKNRVLATDAQRARPAALGARDRRGERSDVRGEDHGAGTAGRRRLHRPPPRMPA